MSDLTDTRDHARKMAIADHRRDCPSLNPPARPIWSMTADGTSMAWLGGYTPPPPHCPGCVSDSDRALWAQIADEIDHHLACDHEQHDQPLDFGAAQ